MAAPRFFAPFDLTPAAVGSEIALPDAVAHHAVRVLRLAAGAAITLFTGDGGEYAATIARIDKRGATAAILHFDPVERESPLAVTLAQAVAANDAMDNAVRKAVELGAAAIQPVVTARSAPLAGGERTEKRLAHWRQIAVAACEQCGRNRVPPVAAPIALAEWLAAWSGDGIVLDPGAVSTLSSVTMSPGPLAVLIGPEGGLAEREIAAATARGFVAVRLGPRVLRTETAGTAILAAFQMMGGDFR
ncbi:MAG: 16S rRNA (uracil(1498)-N(3))-methyltransferase [Betaproteobacteria bacterium]